MIFSAFFLLCFCVLIGLTICYMLINPATLIPKINAIVEEKTGYTISTNGKINFTLYPLLAIDIDELSLAKPNRPDSTIILKQVAISSPWQLKWTAINQWQSTIRAKEVFFNHLKATDAKTHFTVTNNALSFEQLTATFYQGTIAGTIQFEKQPTPLSRWQFDFNQIDVEALLHDLHGTQSHFTIRGLATIHFTGSAHKQADQTFLQALTGTLQFNMASGALNGIDLNYVIDKGIALLKHEKTNREKTNNTQFDQFSGTVYLAEGIAKSNDLTLLTDAFTARVTGEMQLTNQVLDISLQVTPKNEPRLMIPLMLSGPVTKPTVSLDMLIIQAILTKEEIERLSEKAEKELKRIPENAKKIIDQLFGQ